MDSQNTSEGMTSQVTVLIQRLRQGEKGALDELMPLVYRELHRIAQSFMRRQQPGHTLQPTALVNEAYLKLVDSAHAEFSGRAHFLAVMACAMRQVLVDHARALGAAKRGGGGEVVPWDTNIRIETGRVSQELQMLELNDALEALAAENQSLAKVVEMHYFGGLTAEESAVVLGRSAHAVRHDLRLARAWLRRKLAQ